MKAKIQTITKEAFKEFGQIVDLPPKEDPAIASPTLDFWTQQAVLSINGDAEVCVLNVKKQEMVFEELENHFKTPTVLICLSGDWAIGVTTPGDAVPKAEDIKAFRVPKNQLVSLDAKCWHTAPYPIDHDESSMLVICENGFLDNDTVFEKINQPGELVF